MEIVRDNNLLHCSLNYKDLADEGDPFSVNDAGMGNTSGLERDGKGDVFENLENEDEWKVGNMGCSGLIEFHGEDGRLEIEKGWREKRAAIGGM